MYTRFRQTSLLFVIKSGVVLIKDTPLYYHTLKKVSEKGEIYKLYTNKSNEIRKTKEGRANAIMLAGGPKIIEGCLLPNNESYKVVQISYIKNNYYLVLKKITDEENNQTSNP